MSAQRADLVLEGGGVKGIALVGAISVLEENGFTFERIAGTSAGAIVGALVAAGYTSAELHEVMQSIDYTKFLDGNLLDHFGLVGEGVTLLLERGIYRGNYLKRWLGDLLGAKKVSTFGDLKQPDPGSSLPADQQYKLVAMTSDISNGCLRRLPWDYEVFGVGADATPVVDAVRASMSIPFFYAPVKLRTASHEDCWMVDGGMLSNFPIDVFDRTDGLPPRWPTIGIKLSVRPDSHQGVQHPIHGVLTMTKAMIETMTGFYDQMHIDDPAVQARTIFVDTFKVSATNFYIDKETQNRLYASGRSAAEKFLANAETRPPA